MGGGGPGGGGAGAPPEAEAMGPCKTKTIKPYILNHVGQTETHENETHSLAPAQSSGVVLLDVGLQLGPNGHIGIDPIHMHLISENKTIKQVGKLPMCHLASVQVSSHHRQTHTSPCNP